MEFRESSELSKDYIAELLTKLGLSGDIRNGSKIGDAVFESHSPNSHCCSVALTQSWFTTFIANITYS